MHIIDHWGRGGGCWRSPGPVLLPARTWPGAPACGHDGGTEGVATLKWNGLGFADLKAFISALKCITQPLWALQQTCH